jgi:hypothetical protein
MMLCVQATQLRTQEEIKALDSTPSAIVKLLSRDGLTRSDYREILHTVLTVFKKQWELNIHKFFVNYPKSFRDMLVLEVQLAVVLFKANPTTLSIASYPKFPSVLQHVFPIKEPTLDEDQMILMQMQTETSWDMQPLHLWWVSIKDSSDYSWFIVADNEKDAKKFFELVLTAHNEPILKTEYTVVCEHIGPIDKHVSDNVHSNQIGWTSMEAIWSLDGDIVVPMFPRVVKLQGKTYKEGTIPIAGKPPTLEKLSASSSNETEAPTLQVKKHLLN